jgi:hypothetical protein
MIGFETASEALEIHHILFQIILQQSTLVYCNWLFNYVLLNSIVVAQILVQWIMNWICYMKSRFVIRFVKIFMGVAWGRSSEAQSRELVSLPKYEPATCRIRNMSANHLVALFDTIVWYTENVLSVKTTFCLSWQCSALNVLSLKMMLCYLIQFSVSQENFLSLNSRQRAVTQYSALSLKTVLCFSRQGCVSQDNFLSLNSKQCVVTQYSALSLKTVLCFSRECSVSQDKFLSLKTMFFYSIQCSVSQDTLLLAVLEQ